MATEKLIANTYLVTNPSNISVPNATLTQIASLSLAKGTWLVIASHQYSTSSTTLYSDSFQVNGTASNRDVIRASMSNGGGATLLRLYKLETDSVISYHTYQATGAAVSANYIQMQAIRIS